ncbi:MAG: MipA/OmpV family protein [Thermodesulfobacteriota bacterium]|nr:MipA/OmpV family protein [Thermodesulfobacteriota bacterium]
MLDRISFMKMQKIWRTLLLSYFLLKWGVIVFAAELTVSLDNPPTTGTVIFMLFDSANTFSDLRDPVKISKQSMGDRKIYLLEDVPHGEYALIVYYDENDNDLIDKNFIGIPKEPIGFSNRYEPKGPPSYSRAAFLLREGESPHFDVKLNRPLGKRGRLGLGVGVIARSSPYRDYNGSVSQVIPAIAYNGECIQIFGPNIQIGLVGSGKLRLAATGKYRIGVYDEDESDFLIGMGDRKDTFMLGLALQAELSGGVDLSVGFEHDVLNEIGGSEASLDLDKSFQFGVFRLSPELGLNWSSSELSNHDFGVSSSKATPDRPFYYFDDTISIEGGIGMFIKIARDWLVIARASVEKLAGRVNDSPIVEKGYVMKGFFAINYQF